MVNLASSFPRTGSSSTKSSAFTLAIPVGISGILTVPPVTLLPEPDPRKPPVKSEITNRAAKTKVLIFQRLFHHIDLAINFFYLIFLVFLLLEYLLILF